MIRQALAHEAAEVRGVVLSAYQRYVAVIGTMPGPMLDDYAMRIAADQVWVLEEAGEVVGVLVLEERPNLFLLDNIALRPDRQGLGLGRLLLDFAEAEAERRGWDTITLYTHALMAENIAIYTGRGYAQTARRTENGFDRIYMQRRLGRR